MDTQAGAHAVQTHRADGGDVASMIFRDLVEHPSARSSAPVQSGQTEIATHLVDEDEVLTRQTLSEFTKLLAGLFVSLTGDKTFLPRQLQHL